MLSATSIDWSTVCSTNQDELRRPQFRSTGTSDVEQSSCWPSSPRHFSRNIQTQTEDIFVCSVTVDSAHYISYSCITRFCAILAGEHLWAPPTLVKRHSCTSGSPRQSSVSTQSACLTLSQFPSPQCSRSRHHTLCFMSHTLGMKYQGPK